MSIPARSTQDVLATVSRTVKVMREAATALESLAAVLAQRDERIARFRENSAARVVAEVLLAYPDQWMAKEVLAQTAQVSPSTVPQVVATLTRSGVKVERKVENRKAMYRVAS